MRNPRPALVGIALVLFGQATAADHDRAKDLRESGDILPLTDIVTKAGTEHHGRVIEVDLIRKGRRYIYEVEIVDEKGMVWRMLYDASTGRKEPEQ